MSDIDTIVSELQGRLSGDGIGGSIKFDFEGEGCVLIDGATVSQEDKPADCTITVAMDDFKEMAKGNLDPTMAFMQGKLKVDGDMGLAMKLAPLMQG